MPILPPPVIYKYLSHDGGLASLRKLSVKYTPINEFNDPFEGMLRNFNEQELEELIRRATEALQTDISWRKFCNNCHVWDPDELYRCRMDLRSGRMNLAHHLKTALSLMSADLMARFPNAISETHCIACFSSCFDSVLMWSHYAHNHEGIVIGYHSRYLGPLYPVQYRTERVPLPVGQFANKKGCLPESMWHYKALTTKFSDWEYEHEWRGVEDRKNLLPQNAKPSDALYCRVRPQAIASVIMGTRTGESLRNECRMFKKRHPACRLLQARYHERDFALVFDSVD